MSSIQRYLPILEASKPNVLLGLVDLGANVVFQGDETSLTFSTAGGDADLTLLKVTPVKSEILAANPWFMAAAFSHEDVLNKAYMSFGYVPLKDVMSATTWSSGSGLANVLRHTEGLAIRGISEKDGYGVSLPLSEPVNTVAPVASNAVLVLSVTDGTWSPNGDITYQWQSNSGSWADIVGADADEYTAPGAGSYRCVVTCTNVRGATSVNSNTVTLT